MGKYYLKPKVLINSTALAGVRSATVNAEAAELDFTDSDAAGSESGQGLRKDTIELNLFQDHAALGVDAVLWPLFDDGTEFEIEVVPQGGAVSDTNPGWSGSGIILKAPPIDGDVGAAAMLKVSISINGKLSRVTT